MVEDARYAVPSHVSLRQTRVSRLQQKQQHPSTTASILQRRCCTAHVPPNGYLKFSTCRSEPSVGFLAPTESSTARQRSTSSADLRPSKPSRLDHSSDWGAFSTAKRAQAPALVRSGRPPPRIRPAPNKWSPSRPLSNARGHPRCRAEGMPTCHSSPSLCSAEPSTACCHAKSVSDITSAESPPTPGTVGREVSPGQMANFRTLVDNLRDAAQALQQAMPAHTSTSTMATQASPVVADTNSKNGHANSSCQAQKSLVIGQPATCREADVTKSHDQSLGTPAACTKAPLTTEKLLVPAIERLAVENAALRQSVALANERLSQLEEEKQRFLDETVFDLVNSVCGKTRISRRMSDCAASGGSSASRGSLEQQLPSVNLSPKSALGAARPALAAAVLFLEEGDGLVELRGRREQEELTPQLPDGCPDQATENELHFLAQEQLHLSQRWARLLVAGSAAGPFSAAQSASVCSPQKSGQQHLQDRPQHQHQQQSWRSSLEDPSTSPEDPVLE